MKTQPLKGMRDLLPREQALRDYIQGQILATYRAAGFQRISTPILEDMENLDKSDGGDNLNLIFKVLKRGDKLEHALASGDEKQLSDMGLRYDLTLPLSRYYAANRNELPSPFKVIQTDRVYRAERPQKGRLREFVQCDIDILGDSSPNAEVELIDVTARALLKIGFTGFTVNINDRRILRAMLEKMGFAADQLDSVCISFDKMDKIGADGVKAELTEKGFAAEAVQALDDFLRAGDFSLDTVAARVDDEALTADLRYVIAASEKVAGGRYGIAYAPSLVRGQGYYTGHLPAVQRGRGRRRTLRQHGRQVHRPAGARRGLLHRIRARLRHFAGAGLPDPRREAEDGAALPEGRRLCRRAGQGRILTRRLRRDRAAPGEEAGQAVRHAGGRGLQRRCLCRQRRREAAWAEGRIIAVKFVGCAESTVHPTFLYLLCNTQGAFSVLYW